LADDLGQDYSMLSKLSEKEGATIAIILLLKIERAKHYYFITMTL
jgi:hypothetical protein